MERAGLATDGKRKPLMIGGVIAAFIVMLLLGALAYFYLYSDESGRKGKRAAPKSMKSSKGKGSVKGGSKGSGKFSNAGKSKKSIKKSMKSSKSSKGGAPKVSASGLVCAEQI